jgi:RNA-binding protein YhbY
MEQNSIEIVCGSFDDHKNYFVSKNYEKKNIIKVKILKTSKEETSEVFEEKINNTLLDLNGKYEIIDIKYVETSCMIIYKKV